MNNDINMIKSFNENKLIQKIELETNEEDLEKDAELIKNLINSTKR